MLKTKTTCVCMCACVCVCVSVSVQWWVGGGFGEARAEVQIHTGSWVLLTRLGKLWQVVAGDRGAFWGTQD